MIRKLLPLFLPLVPMLCYCILFTNPAYSQNNLCSSLSKSPSSIENLKLTEMLLSGKIKSAHFTFINKDVFKAKSIVANLSGDFSTQLKKQNIGHTGVSYKTWTGQSIDKAGSAAFIINGNRISGHIATVNGNFEICPIGNEGAHVILQYNNDAFGSCGNEVDRMHENIHENNVPLLPNYHDDPLPDFNTNRSMAGDECFVRVVVAYTQLAQTNTANQFGRTMNEHIALAVTESNQGYANSNVEMRMELAYLYETDDNETNNACNDVDDLQDTNDGRFDEIHTRRNNYDGDMVCLVTGGLYATNDDCNPNSGLCGLAFEFDYTSASNMFQVSEFSCVTGNFTFAHEFGHTQGARHDNDNTGSPFSYARGFNEGPNFRTVMAVCCNPQRVNYWSNPDINWPGTGTSTGTATRDNARALDVGDFTVAHHRTTPNSFTTGIVINNDETLNMVAANSITSSNTIQNGGWIELKTQSSVTLSQGFWAKSGSQGFVHIIGSCPGTTYSLNDDNGEVENK